MKDEKAWDYTVCNIGNPCRNCISTCSFIKLTCSRDNDQDEKEKEKENERTIEESKGTV